MILFSCMQCLKSLKVKDDLAGKKVKCPQCGAAIVVPSGQETVASGIEPSQKSSLPTSRETRLPVEAPSAQGEDATVSSVSSPREASETVAGAGKRREAASELTEFLAPAEREDELGRLGTYRVLSVLGHGGMGVVFRAEDPHLERMVALKAMLPGLAKNPANRERFLREAKAAAAIKDDHVVGIFQISKDRGVPFVAMEFLEGESLDARLKRPPALTPAEILRIGRETALGLAAAHRRGLIHRDIKPGNLWLEGDRAQVKILDFGLARAVQDNTHLTQSGAIVGTPAYMSPE